ncbi:hypothetical protein A3L09_10700 (plasmid) [Thermococcus profundus]|uniref:Uncharacterized protein n=1 Tax=Thermococcus profundus TaxID=49899 RepID=A0A2Z2ME65_THEPR|nr:hypothetical protein [Thermococcus profundus]ASJ03819.1 hypothetical protein A3L09_10700 [Thermococcus profundus]
MVMRLDLSVFSRVIAVLKNAEVVKDEGLGGVYPGCRGFYDNSRTGRVWCRCNEGEICQVKLAEALEVTQSTMSEFSDTIALLVEYHIVDVRIDRSVRARNKPRKYYSLNPEWRENFVVLLDDLVRAQEQRLLEDKDDLMRSLLAKRDVASSRVRAGSHKKAHM